MSSNMCDETPSIPAYNSDACSIPMPQYNSDAWSIHVICPVNSFTYVETVFGISLLFCCSQTHFLWIASALLCLSGGREGNLLFYFCVTSFTPNLLKALPVPPWGENFVNIYFWFLLMFETHTGQVAFLMQTFLILSSRPLSSKSGLQQT